MTTVAHIDALEIAADAVRRASKRGATAAEAFVRESSQFSSLVRLGEVERLEQAGSRNMGLRVFLGQRSASSFSSDFTPKGIEVLVDEALGLAQLVCDDPFAGLPEACELGSLPGDLRLFYEDVHAFPAKDRIDYARRAEKASREFDGQIFNSEGGSFEAFTGRKILVNSLGFSGDYKQSHCSVSAAPIAQDGKGGLQRDFWFSIARTIRELESPEGIGREAARRVLRRLGARKIPSSQVAIILDPVVSQSLLGNIFDAVNGDLVCRDSTFLAGKLGQKVAGSDLTVIDDGTLPGGFGTSPFDAEGVLPRHTVVIEKGVLKSYLLNTYSARKLGLRSTGNAARVVGGDPRTAAGNLFVVPGSKSPQSIVAETARGLYVTELLGFGVNVTTGDFSRGAIGLWIENGEFVYPVEEITVSGNLRDMLNNISEIGSDLEFRGSMAAPTVRVEGMTVAGR
jgi:PmbA protein